VFASGGHHLAAYNQQTALYREACDRARRTGTEPIAVLDYGCGAKNGVSREIFEGILDARDRLYLFDVLDVQPSHRPMTHVVQEPAFQSANPLPCDIVNLSYVLCMLETAEARELLRSLAFFQRSALFTVVDYTLATRSEAEVLRLLGSKQERTWRERLGEKEFLRTHRRFSPVTLQELVTSAGLTIERVEALDPASLRAGLMARRS